MKSNARTLTDIYDISPNAITFKQAGPRDEDHTEVVITGSCNAQPDFDVALMVNGYRWGYERNHEYKGVKKVVLANPNKGVRGHVIEVGLSDKEQGWIDEAGLNLATFAKELLSSNKAQDVLAMAYKSVDAKKEMLKVDSICFRDDDTCEISICRYDSKGISAKRKLLTVIVDLDTKNMHLICNIESTFTDFEPMSVKQYCQIYKIDSDLFKKTFLDYVNEYHEQN